MLLVPIEPEIISGSLLPICEMSCAQMVAVPHNATIKTVATMRFRYEVTLCGLLFRIVMFGYICCFAKGEFSEFGA